MNESEFARHRKVAKQTVSKWKARGFLVMAGKSVDVEASDAALDARPATYRGGTASQPAGMPPIATHFASTDWSLAEAARRKEVAIALKRQLDFDVAFGKLVNAADVEAIMRSDYATTAARILQIPSKVAPRVAAMQTAAEVEALLHKEFVKALNALAKDADSQLRKLDAP